MIQSERRERIREIYQKSPIPPSPTELAKILNCSRRMVYNDIKALGLPLRQGAPTGFTPISRPQIRDYSQGVLKIEGDAVISADYHSPFFSQFLLEMLIAIAQHSRLSPIKTHILDGDLLDQYVFAFWDRRNPQLQWTDELEITRELCKKLFAAFEITYILPGNHTRRLLRLTSFQLTFQNLMDMLKVPLDNVVLSEHDYCILNGTWRITHPKSFRQASLSVANELAAKHQQNIIMHHGHFTNLGVDKTGHYIIADGGGMFDEKFFDYRMLEDSTYRAWEPGFFVIKNNKPYVFNERMTDWNFWLNKK